MCGPMRNPQVDTRSRILNSGPYGYEVDALPHNHGHHKLSKNLLQKEKVLLSRILAFSTMFPRLSREDPINRSYLICRLQMLSFVADLEILSFVVSSLTCVGSVKSLDQGSPSIEAVWSNWIDKSHPSYIRVLSEDEAENLNHGELGRLCPYGVITEIECMPVKRVDGLHKGLEQNVTCDLQNGLTCLAKYNRPHGCLGYKIRYRCSPHLAKNVRKRQASMPSANCNSWHPWINENHPNSTNKNDHENLTVSELLYFCPINNGAQITKIECKDNKGEPFSGLIKDKLNRYEANCTNYRDGLSCEMIDLNSKDKCPDFSFRFYCNCSVPVAPSLSSVISGGTQATHRVSYSSSNTTSSVRQKTTTVTSSSRSDITSTVRSSLFYTSARTSSATSNMFTKTRPKPTTTITKGTRVSTSSVRSPVSKVNRGTSKRFSVNTSPVLIPNQKQLSSNTSYRTTSMSLISSRGSNKTGHTTMNSEINANTTGTQSNSEQKFDGFAIGSQFLWLILIIVCFVLCVFNIILMLFLHKRAMNHAKGKCLSKVKPLSY